MTGQPLLKASARRLLCASLALLALAAAGSARASGSAAPQPDWAGLKGQFRPAGQSFPQVLQGSDAATIAAIEALYAALEGGADLEAASFTLADDSLHFDPGKGKAVELKFTDRGVAIDKREFKAPKTALLFSTFHKVLAALGKGAPKGEVRFAQLSGRATKSRTIIEFGFLPDVVVLESLSNGGSRDDLYFLDIRKSDEAFLWSQ